MSDGNEEDLQKRVAELEATVRGLTEELVDATERIRQLEEKHGLHESAAEKREARTRQRQQAEADEDSDVTAQPTDSDAEAGKSEEPQSSDESEESDLSDDIIVA